MSGRPSAGRGPTGAALLPPTWLRDTALPIEEVPTGQVLHRIHRIVHGPVFFGPGPGVGPIYRFDSASGRFGVLYVGMARAGALTETILRNPARLMVAMADITSRAASTLTCGRTLRVVALHGAGLQRVGTDNAISTGPYERCGLWADALWAHPDAPDGIAYRSRHDPDELCLALFERPDLPLDVTATAPLSTILPEIAALLNRYGKSITT